MQHPVRRLNLSLFLLLLPLLLTSAQAAPGGGLVQVQRLDVLVSNPTYAERRELDIPNGGVMVREVKGTGPGFHAGLRPGDVILAYDQVVVDSLQHLTDLVSAVRTDKPTPLLVLRGHRYVALALQLG